MLWKMLLWKKSLLYLQYHLQLRNLKNKPEKKKKKRVAAEKRAIMEANQLKLDKLPKKIKTSFKKKLRSRKRG